MSEQIPAEFDFIYPFNKGTFSEKTNPHFGEDTAFLSFPKKGKCPYTGKDTWVCEISSTPIDQPCSHFKKWQPNISIILTREQAEVLKEALKHVQWWSLSDKFNKIIDQLFKQIEEKLK